MKRMFQEKNPQVTFSTLRGGKGYIAEEVNVYIETIRSAYWVLETEFHTVKTENSKLAAELKQIKTSYGEEKQGYKQKLSELSRMIEAKKENNATAPEMQQEISALREEIRRRDEEIRLLKEAQQGMKPQRKAENSEKVPSAIAPVADGEEMGIADFAALFLNTVGGN